MARTAKSRAGNARRGGGARKNPVNYIFSERNGRWLVEFKTGPFSKVKVGTYASFKAAEKARARDWKKRQKNPGAFERCVAEVTAKGKARSPRGVCATAGRKKYGAKQFAAMARKGELSSTAKRGGGRRRGNPEGAAAETYEKFHGRPPGEVIDVSENIHEHSVLSGIGKLVSLTVLAVDGRNQVVLSGFKGALLAQNEKGSQLFVKGGDQSIPLEAFGISRPHESEVLGAVVEVVYHTRKDHLRPEDGGTADYHHKFGERGSRLPLLIYDVRNRLLQFSGGGYTLPEVGIRG